MKDISRKTYNTIWHVSLSKVFSRLAFSTIIETNEWIDCERSVGITYKFLLLPESTVPPAVVPPVVPPVAPPVVVPPVTVTVVTVSLAALPPSFFFGGYNL